MTSRTQLLEVLEGCVERAEGEPLTLGAVFDAMHEASFGFICVIHILPFLQPISVGPLSTVGGLSLAALGWQMMTGRETPWLPARMRALSLSARTWRILLRTCERVLRICARLTRPRMIDLAVGPKARRLGGFLVGCSGVLLAIPLGGLPFNNLLPALVILFVSVGELEEDGAMVIVAFAFLFLTLAYFGFLVWALVVMGDHAFDWFRSVLPGF